MLWISILAFAVSVLGASSTCYYPNGTANANLVACGNTKSEHAACCASTDECLTNGLCKADGMLSTRAFWRDGCTDPNWQSDACPKYCYNSTTSPEASSSNSFVLACTSDHYCCASQSTALSTGNYEYCCTDIDAIFAAPAPAWLSGPHYDLPNFTSSAQSSSSSSQPARTVSRQTNGVSTGASRATTTAGKDDSSTSLSSGVAAGIGVGVAVAVVALGILGFVLYRLRTSRKRHGQGYEKPPITFAGSKDGTYNGEGWQHYQGGEQSKLWPNSTATEIHAANTSEMSSDNARLELATDREPAELGVHE